MKKSKNTICNTVYMKERSVITKETEGKEVKVREETKFSLLSFNEEMLINWEEKL